MIYSGSYYDYRESSKLIDVKVEARSMWEAAKKIIIERTGKQDIKIFYSSGRGEFGYQSIGYPSVRFKYRTEKGIYAYYFWYAVPKDSKIPII